MTKSEFETLLAMCKSKNPNDRDLVAELLLNSEESPLIIRKACMILYDNIGGMALKYPELKSKWDKLANEGVDWEGPISKFNDFSSILE